MTEHNNRVIPVPDIKCLECIHFKVCTHYIGGMNLQMASLDCKDFETIGEKDEVIKAQADKIFLYERVIKDKNVEIERLTSQKVSREQDRDYWMAQTRIARDNIKFAKSKAIKEFWSKLVSEYESVNGQYVDRVMNRIAKDIMKEIGCDKE